LRLLKSSAKKYFFLIIVVCFVLFLVTCKTPAAVIPELVIEQEPVQQELIIVELEEPPIGQPPQMGAASMEILSIDSVRAEIIITVNFDNPNVFAVPSPKITYNYLLNRHVFIRGIIENERTLNPSSVTPVSFRLFVNYTDLFRSFPALRNQNEVPSLIVLTYEFGAQGGGEIVNLEIAGVLPLR